MSTVVPIALYPQNNEPGMIACRYGNGTVFLSFPHSEYEEEVLVMELTILTFITILIPSGVFS
jgi:glutamine amidotransferase-like uncharacterized protein